MTQAWTILKLLQWTTDYLKTKEMESPRLEAEVLLAHSLNLKRIDLYVQFERPLSAVELASFKTLLKRRVDHEPLAYIVGKKEFYGREFFVSPGVLVPRPETEMLVECVLSACRSSPSPALRAPSPQMGEGKDVAQSALVGFEIGLGSGCIAISLLCEIPTLTMDAVEISEKATQMARKNAEKHGVSDRLNISKADFLSPQNTEYGRRNTVDGRRSTQYDFIVSNPPYVSFEEMQRLPDTVKKFEPHQALEAGSDGLLFYPAIATFAKKHLKTKGLLAVEIGEDQGYRVAEIFKEVGFGEVEVRKDFARRDRVVVAGKA
jgi:release factor glutamine methyltransferase